jgi:ABC-2 type transport system permease protein
MSADILTVMWKEWKSLFEVRGGRGRYLLIMAVPVLMGLYGPLRDGAAWASREEAVVIAAITAFVLVAVTITDAFAGERERHTLETLLASRLPDRAILLGKVAASMLLAWVVALATALLGLIVVNLAHWNGRLILFTPLIALATVALSFLVAALTASLGVLISMRSATAQRAAQTLMLILLIPPQIFIAILLIDPKVLGRTNMNTLSGETRLLVIATVLAVASAVLFAIAMARFKRATLILIGRSG